MGLPVTRISELVRGKRGIMARSALRLGRLFDATPQFWIENGLIASELGHYDVIAKFGEGGTTTSSTSVISLS